MTGTRLIEEYLPVGSVSYEATREKVLRRRDYHISTLHLWWARKPLAAARAAVYAALVPTRVIDSDKLSTLFKTFCAWGGPESAVESARADVLSAFGGNHPKVLDPFAGGGSIPLEAIRLGCDVTALDLNPVAHLIELCTLDYPQRFGDGLARDFERWGSWVVEKTRSEIGAFYPDPADELPRQQSLEDEVRLNRRVPIAYLSTRTVPCPNPAERPHRVPLVSQTWISKKPGKFIAFRPVADRADMRVKFEVVESPTREGLGFDPEDFSKRGSTTCPLCGAPLELKYVKAEAKAGRMGTEVMGVGFLTGGRRGKTYIGSKDAEPLLPDEDRLARALTDLADEGLTPPEVPVPERLSGGTCYGYGLTRIGDLFTLRQQVLLLTLSKFVREAHREMLSGGVDAGRARAVATYLGFLVDRMSDRHSTLCTWDNTKEGISSTFSRQALPMTWDFIEANPFGGSGGDLAMHVETIAKVISHCATTGTPARVVRGSAAELPFEDDEFDAVITDPPYYDNHIYADLSDFFYGWLQRSIGDLYPEHLGAAETPKRREIVMAAYRHSGNRDAARESFEGMLVEALREARRVLKPSGIMVCIYAHQTTAGWASLIEAMRGSGFVVVEAWPLDTEMPTRPGAQGTASLASSIFLVARPREDAKTGDWAHDVRPELEEIVTQRVHSLSELGIAGTDLVIAAVGAGMRAYTRYARVEKPNGEELGPEEYLGEVEREVAGAVLERIFGTDRNGLGRVDQATQFYVIGRFEFGDALAPWDELNTLARGTGVELRELADGAGSLLSFGAKRNEALLRDYRERGSAIELGLSTIDHLHRVLWLADNEPTKIKDYLSLARPDSDRLRLVAHALSRPGLDSSGTRGAEADACERLLGVWKRLVEDNLFTAGDA